MQYRARTPSVVRELLDEYGALARKTLLEFIPDREPKKYLYELVADYPKRGGRGMRPALHIATAKAFGAALEQALATATSIELLHNALLVLDDIQDESEERRGRPTLHKQHGVPMAMNAGQSMSILSLVPLLGNVATNGPEMALWLFEAAIRMAQSAAEGQAMELGWRRDNRVDVTQRAYLDMVLRKTCAYSTLFPICAGAMVGLGRREVPNAISRYAYLLGATFQAQDDLLNIAGATESYGKEEFGDLLEGKRTLLTIRLFEVASDEERLFLRGFLGLARDQKSERDLMRVVDMIGKYGVVEHVRRLIQSMAGAAQFEFERGFSGVSPSRDLELLRFMPLWVIEQT